MIFASGHSTNIVMRSTDYGVSFQRLADAPVQLDRSYGSVLTIADDDSVFLGPGINRQYYNSDATQRNGEFYKLSLSTNTWTEMATFPEFYHISTCTLWLRAPGYEKELYCFATGDYKLWIYNVAREAIQ